ncbi:hypothetical protein E0765_04740 [Sulfuricurvum sp. IAE1]|uniref:hypothetical protein n=1 Tax=Sulfuricurvum sp. IAE1 TaxID=2546102 RepID=UPI001042D81B|nr:hypothetical protein [Sulfuricurvum sp. IAE1]TDA65792.1 hypothetical protein E0765_04740 [Sulfuricurvum sp. IAE1]
MAQHTKRLVPKRPLGHVILALEDYFGSRGGHGIAGEVAAIFEPHIEDREVKEYCEHEFGVSVLSMAQILHKQSAK